MTVPSGIAPCGCALLLGAAFVSSLGIRDSGCVLIPSRPGLTIALAISCALSLAILWPKASITIGKFIPDTIAQVSSCSLTRLFAWLNGVPPHRSIKNNT